MVFDTGTLTSAPLRMDADAGLMPVQLRFETGLTGTDYVTREAWRDATNDCRELLSGRRGLARTSSQFAVISSCIRFGI